MQSIIILAVIVVSAVFMTSEYSRNGTTTNGIYQSYKAENIAANILQYNDLMIQFMLKSYEFLHLTVSLNPGTVEQSSSLDYQQNHIAGYSQKNLLPFLNYTSITFNYIPVIIGESKQIPELYLATSWDSLNNQVIQGLPETTLTEAMGQLGQEVSKRLYQGNSTYWVVPWIFSQSNCKITEVYSQVANDARGMSAFNKLESLFNLICTQIQANSSYKFLTYVYLQPVLPVADM